MSKRSGKSNDYTPGDTCFSSGSMSRFKKERFLSQRSAIKAARRKRKWRGKDHPYAYLCESCHGWHLSGADKL